MSETTAPGRAKAAPAADDWPTAAHRARMAAAAEDGWQTAMTTYEKANGRLMERVTDPERDAMDAADRDKAVLEDAKFAGAVKTAWSAVETAWRAMGLARPPSAAAPDLRRADDASITESRRRLARLPDGREAAAAGGPETGPEVGAEAAS